jgi:hypothetical protein
MRGRPKHVEEVLPELWQVLEELQRWTEGLEEQVAARKAEDKRRGPDDT